MADKKETLHPSDLAFKEKDTALKAAKEIAVKFIECGKVSPDSFQDIFPRIYSTILKTLTS